MEQNNSFNDISFWLHLACMDFTFGFEATVSEANTKDEARNSVINQGLRTKVYDVGKDNL